jgi:site-specific recombinase XerD
MAYRVRSDELEHRTNRLALSISSNPLYVKVGKGVALGYRRNRTNGAWVARVADGKGGYTIRNIGVADDFADADGEHFLDYFQAAEAARRAAGQGAAITTVSVALDDYEANLKRRGQDAANVARIRRHLTDALAAKPVEAVTSKEWERWRDRLAMKPASINRTCRALRAALNLAAKHNRNLDPHNWRTGLASLPDAEESRNVILDQGTVSALVTAAHQESLEFGLLVETAAQTGARPSQLRRVLIHDLAESKEGPRLSVPVSRKGRGTKAVKHRTVPISEGLAARLKVASAGRARTAPLLTRPSGEPWAHSDQKKPFRRVAAAAGEDPKRVTIYALRHSYIVRQLLAGVLVRVVADAADTSIAMIEKTYSAHIGQHTDALLRGALFDTETVAEGVVVPLRQG